MNENDPNPDATLVRPEEEQARLAAEVGFVSVPGFEIDSTLGRGGMGVVYKAKQTGLNRVVALKMLIAGPYADPSLRARFLLEAESVAALEHPGVVKVFAFGEYGGYPYLAMEYIPGGTLAARIATSGPLPAKEAAELMANLAAAVAHAHSRGVVHRDIKPLNVLLTADGEPRLADFGLAKVGRADQNLTVTGVPIGTPAYMAPEQAAGKVREVGTASDVYALGAVLYDLLTGRPPFQGDSAAATLQKVLTEEPDRPRKLNPTIPLDLETICLKCLEKPPEKRYPTAQALADDLLRYLRNEPISVRPVGALERGVKWMRRNPTLASLYAAVAAVAFLAVVGAALAWVASAAVAARHDAEAERATAEDAKRDALTERQLAVDAKGEAEKQKRNAESAYAEAARARAELDELAYRQKVYLARVAWGENNVLRALRLLTDTKPEHRNWEWRYVAKLCRSEVRTIRPGGRVWRSAVSPDERFVYVACFEDGTVRGFELATGRETVVFREHRKRPYDLVLIDDGKQVVSRSADGAVFAWDAATGKLTAVLAEAAGRNDWHGTLAVSPDGKTLVISNGDTVTVWDAETKKKGIAFGAKSPIALAIHSDGRLFTVGADRALRVWDLKTGKEVRPPIPHDREVHSVAIAPDGRSVWTGDEAGTVHSWDAAALTANGHYPVHSARVWDIQFAPDGGHLVTCSLDQTAALWELPGVKPVRVFRGHIEDVVSAAFLRRAKAVVTSGDGSVRVWDATRDAECVTLTPARPVGFPANAPVFTSGVTFSPDGHLVAIASAPGVYIWDAATGKPVPGWPDRAYGSMNAVAFSPDGKSVAGATFDGTLWVRPVSGGDGRRWNVGVQMVTGIGFDPTGTRVAVAGLRGGLKFWDTTTGTAAWQADAPVFGLALSRDGKTIAASEGLVVRLRNAETGESLRTLVGHTRPVRAVTFSADAARVATGSEDTTTRVWDAATGKQQHLLRTHDHYIYGVAFTPDGSRLIDASGDKTIRVYETRTGQEILTLRGHTDEIIGAAFSAVGDRLATCSEDGTVRLWEGPSGIAVTIPKEADQSHTSD